MRLITSIYRSDIKTLALVKSAKLGCCPKTSVMHRYTTSYRQTCISFCLYKVVLGSVTHFWDTLFQNDELGGASMLTIDLNSDLGESFGNFKVGQDDKVLDLITSANIACGYHAGDHNVMARTVELCVEKNVGIGAHPGFYDLFGFGL